jgi:SulP family sulfate permease
MTSTGKSKNPSGLARYVPIVQWASKYDRGWLRPDLIAGLTVAALVIPKSLGYAGIAQVPIQNGLYAAAVGAIGLYAAAVGAIIYAIFGTCKQIATGPSSALAAVAAGSEEAVTLVAAIIFVTCFLFLPLTLFRMGWISQFLSKVDLAYLAEPGRASIHSIICDLDPKASTTFNFG